MERKAILCSKCRKKVSYHILGPGQGQSLKVLKLSMKGFMVSRFPLIQSTRYGSQSQKEELSDVNQRNSFLNTIFLQIL